MTIPSYIDTGYSSDSRNSVALATSSAMRIASRLLTNPGTSGTMNLAPTYGTNIAGDLFLAQVYVRNLSVAISTPDGWTPRGGPDTFGNSSSYWFTRDERATGFETGGAIFVVGGNAAVASIHTFRDVALTSFFESLSANGSASNTDTMLAPSVTSTGADRLAVAAGGAGEVVVPSDFTGETGGDWLLKFSVFTLIGNNGTQWLQTADLAAAGTISGGSFMIASMENYSQQGFALVGT